MNTILTPRDYQANAISTIANLHNRRTSRVVLAAATGSGKTEMSIMIIENFLRTHRGSRVLVIAHHTNIIKSNFFDRLCEVNPNFSFSTTNPNVQCFVTIRSKALNRIDTTQFDLIVVDEAHQNYFANTIQNIVRDINHQVLLTATPSKFVHAGGFDILPIARLDIPNEFFANLSFRVINADCGVTESNYNDDGSVRTDYKFHRHEVKSMCDAVISHLDDQKKLFICKDIQQAKATALYLTSLGIQTFVSDSKSDADCQVADKFKSGGINSLCVVDRMRVGYSDKSLYHTVDMSFTHNPDVIMQILSRSNRGNQSQSKQYIKLTNDDLNAKTRFMLSVSVSLFRSDNLTSFNGFNPANLQVPIRKNAKPNRDNSASAAEWFMPDNVDVIDFFSDCDFVPASDVITALRGYTTYETCLIAASTSVDYRDFRTNSVACYSFLVKNNLLDQFILDTGLKKAYSSHDYTSMSDDQLLDIAMKYTSSKDLFTNECSAYNEIRSRKLAAIYTRQCKCCQKSYHTNPNQRVIEFCSDDCRKAKNKLSTAKYRSKKKNLAA